MGTIRKPLKGSTGAGGLDVAVAFKVQLLHRCCRRKLMSAEKERGTPSENERDTRGLHAK